MTDQAISIGTAAPAQPRADARGWVRPLMVVFVISLLIPGTFNVFGGITLSASRLVVLLAIIPLVMAWLGGAAGRIILPDLLMIAHAVWMLVAYIYNHGGERIPFGIITGIELYGGYLMGRIMIRSPEDFRRFFRYMLVAFVILLPFVLYELQTGRPIMQTISRTLFGISHGGGAGGMRMGFWRVQSVMQHPILFGVFCSISIANIFYIWRENIAKALSGAGLALFLTFSSLSSGPLLAGMSQLCMILWGRMTGNNWRALVIIAVALYLFLSVASNRGPLVLMIETLTFNPGTGWIRIHIYNHGMNNVWASPIFGRGLHDWVRPFWLTPSVDNFWLLTAMRFGVVGFLLLVAALALNVWHIVRAKNLSATATRYRTGYMIGLVGLCFTLSTVHVWGPTYVLTLFYFGAGAWFFVQGPETVAAGDTAPQVDAGNMRSGLAFRRSRHAAAETTPARVPRRSRGPGAPREPEAPRSGPSLPYRRGPADPLGSRRRE